jgi:GT2 family glycosyltransferase
MLMPAPDLSVIIVNWNTRDLLRECLASVFASPGPALEVWVVDNGSSDHSREEVERGFPAARLIANDGNAGFARANNQALERAGGRYALLLNSDTRVVGRALERLVAFMDAHPEAGACGPRLLNPDGTLQPSGRLFPSFLTALSAMLPWPPRLRGALAPALERRDYGRVAEVDEVSGAALLLRRTALERVGALDEGFYFLGEDVDLCWRLRCAGWKVHYVPDAEIVHVWGASRARGSELVRHHAQRAYVRLFRKHRPGAPATTLAALASAITMVRAAAGVVAGWLRGDRDGAARVWSQSRDQLKWLRSP